MPCRGFPKGHTRSLARDLSVPCFIDVALRELLTFVCTPISCVRQIEMMLFCFPTFQGFHHFFSRSPPFSQSFPFVFFFFFYFRLYFFSLLKKNSFALFLLIMCPPKCCDYRHTTLCLVPFLSFF